MIITCHKKSEGRRTKKYERIPKINAKQSITTAFLRLLLFSEWAIGKEEKFKECRWVWVCVTNLLNEAKHFAFFDIRDFFLEMRAMLF